MKLADAGELSLLSLLEKRFRKKLPAVVRGIGDDTAVVRNAAPESLLTTDMMIEKVHFDLTWTTPFQVGFKLVSRNVSDIYAMGGTPDFLLINFAGPKDLDLRFFTRFFDGVAEALRRYRFSLVGGDISRAERVMVSATVAGHAKKPVCRSGARPGDTLYVTGPAGDASCGLEIMKRIGRTLELERGRKLRLPVSWECGLPLVTRHLLPAARPSGRFAARASAMIDISDGLAIDLARLCRESRVGAQVFIDRIPMSAQLRSAADALALDPLELALCGGDDYEMLFTSSAPKVSGAVPIGTIVRQGLFLVDDDGKRRKMPCTGYEHFAV
ncbi:MAG: thiamine-phosphate kinase [Thermodesulfovibrionales bacterium]